VLTITLFGSPKVATGGTALGGFISAKSVALLYYLAATGRPHSREALAALLWPETSDAQALKNLRDVLSNLRRLVEPYLEISRQRVALILDERVAVDSLRFEAALVGGPAAEPDIAELRTAIAHYVGPFLDGFSPSGALPFEEWARGERERFQQLALGTLLRMAALAMQQRAYIEAIACVTRALTIDPTREEAHRQLMLILALSGQRGAALAQYAACRAVLRDELGVDPDEMTDRLYRSILDGSVGSPEAPTSSRPSHKLPALRIGIVGRQNEAAELLDLLHDPAARLISVVGPGGVGKTTLALHVAHRLVTDARAAGFTDGVVFVALAGLDLSGATTQRVPDSAALVATRVADALDFTLAASISPDVQVAQYLRDKHLLLILDNCEHLPLDAFAVALLEQAPRLSILATSRVRLNVGGEHVVELRGLAFPPASGSPTRAADFDAVALFRRTAEAAHARLEWTGTTIEAAAHICRLLGGLPLAVSLAASLARVMPVPEIARELTADLELLTSSRRDLPERHRSLRAVFEHSWRLLSPEEQRALRQLAIFQGGFTREAAASVAGASLPSLTSLVDSSLVRQVPEAAGRGRYELLEVVRQFAAERLAEAGEEGAATAERHIAYYLALVARCGAELRRGGQQEAAAEIAAEIDNVRAAWRRAVEQGRDALLAPAVGGLFHFYEMRGWFREGAEMFSLGPGALRARPTPPATLLGHLLTCQGWCTFQMGRQRDGRALLDEGLAVLRDAKASAGLVPALCYAAAGAYYSGDYSGAQALAAEALAQSQRVGDRHGASVALTVLGQIAALVGRYDDARHYSEASLEIERELENRWGMVFPLISLGRVAQAQGAHREAQGHFQEGMATRMAFNDQRGVALCLRYLGDTATALGEHTAAVWCYREALALFNAIGNLEGAVTALTGLGDAALTRGEPAAARSAFFEALSVARRTSSAPRILDVVAGIADAIAGSEGAIAFHLATLVLEHPAATQGSRDRASYLLGRLVAPAAPAPSLDALLSEQEGLAPLRQAVASLLRDTLH